MSEEMKVCWNCKNSEARSLNDGYWCYAYKDYKNAIENCPKWEADALSAMTARVEKLEQTIEQLIEAESELREYLAFLENQNDGLQKYVSELISTVEKLVEVGDALQNQAYDAWLKDGMLDFSAATDWITLVDKWKEREK